jgi:DNA-binding response OmpR family regulator
MNCSAEIELGVPLQQQVSINAILDKLDSADDAKFRNRREAIRHPCRRFDVTLRAFHPGGSVAFRAVAMRNLSSSGAGFLHTGFLHIGTRVEMTIPRLKGGSETHAGKIIFCAHIAGTYHQIGVRFDHKISPEEHVELVGKANSPARDHALGGSMLQIDNSERDRQLMAHYLGATQVALTSVASGQDALAAMKGGNFDLVMCEANLKGTFSDVVIGQLREAGYKGKVIAVTATDTSPERIQAMQEAGVTDLLSKPYNQARLLSLVGPFLKRVPVVNAEATTPKQQMNSLMQRYMSSIRQLSGDIELATKEKRVDQLEQICSSLRLAEAARSVMQNIDANSSAEVINAQIKELLTMCKSMITR